MVSMQVLLCRVVRLTLEMNSARRRDIDELAWLLRKMTGGRAALRRRSPAAKHDRRQPTLRTAPNPYLRRQPSHSLGFVFCLKKVERLGDVLISRRQLLRFEQFYPPICVITGVTIDQAEILVKLECALSFRIPPELP